MWLRVEDEGESERRPVIGRIGVEPHSDITPRESGLTSLGSGVTREPGQQASGGDAEMSQAATLAGAAPNRGDTACLLPARIVKVSSGKRRRPASGRLDRPVAHFSSWEGLELSPRPTGKQRHTNVEPERAACPEVVTGCTEHHQP